MGLFDREQFGFLQNLGGNNQQNQPAVAQGQDPSIFGGSSGFLQQLLRQQSTGENPAVAASRKAFAGASGRITDRGIRSINEGQAASGFRGGGANLFNDLFAGQSQARAQAEAGFAGQQNQFNQFAQGQLGDLNQFQGGQQSGQLRLEELMRQFDLTTAEGKRQFDLALAEQKRQFDGSQPGFWDVVGGITGGLATGVGTGLGTLIGSDRKLKENIHKTGDKTKDGIPIVTFNYKADPLKIKYTGVIAQDVEKVKPSAVIRAVDYSKLRS